jgi:hypothetical protein
MQSVLRFIAFGLAIIFVIVTVPVIFATSLGQIVTNRQTIKDTLNADELLMGAVESAARQTLESQPALTNLPPLIRDSEPLQAALDNFLPPGWATQQSDQVVDAVFDYFDSGNEEELVINIDIGPLLESLKGESGRQVVLATLQSLPPGTHHGSWFILNFFDINVVSLTTTISRWSGIIVAGLVVSTAS